MKLSGSTVRLIAVIVFAPVVAGLSIMVFTWPAARSAPRHVPVAVVAPPSRIDAVEGALSAVPGRFDLRRAADAQASSELIRRRVVLAAVVVDGPGNAIQVATAAGPALTRQLTPILQQVTGKQAAMVDVVPTPTTDPQGSTINETILPLTLIGDFSALLLIGVTRRGPSRVAILALISAFTGLFGVLITGVWLDVLGSGSFWLDGVVLGANVFAVGCIVLGLHAGLGKAGAPIGVGLLVFLGNAFSGISSQPYLLPTVPRLIGSWLPPGAGRDLLHSTAFFHGWGWTGPTIVLCAWSAVGIVAVFARRALSTRTSGRHEQA